MAEYDVGEAFIRLVPAFNGFVEAVNREAQKWGVSAGTEFGRSFNDTARRVITDPEVTVRVNDAETRAELDRLRAQLDEVTRDREARVRVRADTSDANARLRETQAAADSASQNRSFSISAVTGPAMSAIGMIGQALAGLSAGAVVTPLIAGATSLLGPVSALGAGLGASGLASLPALTNVKNVLSAQQSAQSAGGQNAAAQAQAQAAADAQVKNAELSLESARRQIANSEITSAQQVAAAERALASAQQTALTAQQALSNAREQAARSLQDSANAVKDASLTLQQDELSLTQAQQNYVAVMSSATSTELQREQAALQVHQAQQALVEQQITLQRATQDNNKAQKEGVNQAPTVVAAQQQVKNAQQGVATAEQNVANARRQRAFQAAQNADTLRRAELALAQAHQAQTNAANRTSSSASALGFALSQLTPLEHTLLTAVTSAKNALYDFGHALEPATIPVMVAALRDFAAFLPRLNPLVRATSTALGEALDRIGRVLSSPGMGRLLSTLTGLIGPTIRNLTTIAINLGTAFGHVVEAFAPLSKVVLQGLSTLTGELAKASASPALRQFVREMIGLAPTILRAFGHIGGLVSTLLDTLGHLAGPVFSVVDQLAVSLTGLLKEVGPALTQLFKELAPAVGTILRALGPALGTLIKGLGPAIAALGQGLANIAPALGPLAVALAAMLRLVTPMLPLLGEIIGQLAIPIVQFVTAVSDSMAPLVRQLVEGLAPVIPQLATSLGQFLNALTPLLPAFNQFFIDLIPLIPPLVQLSAQLLTLAAKLLPILVPWIIKGADAFTKSLVPAIKDMVQALEDMIGWVGDANKWLSNWRDNSRKIGGDVKHIWDDVWAHLKGAWTDVRDWFTNEWHAFSKTASNLWGKIARGVTGAFGGIKQFFRNLWRDVEGIFTGAYDWITQDFLNPLISMLDKVLGVFGVHIKLIPVLGSPGSPNAGIGGGVMAAADGGILPGYTPGRDPHRFVSATGGTLLLSGGESVMRPEWTSAVGAPYVQAMNAAARSGGVAGVRNLLGAFAGGGIIGDIFGGIGNVGKALWNGSELSHVVGLLRSGAAGAAMTGLRAAESPLRALIDAGPSKFAQHLAGGMLDKINALVGAFIRGHAASAVQGAIPTGAHLSLIDHALQLARVAVNAANESAVNIIASHESGWNPNAINLTDSNAAAGHPSQGLMQTIPSTFEAYRLPTLPDVITDPLANLVAGVRYAVSRYGSLGNVPGVEAVSHGQPYVGYDAGGFLPPGLSAVYNATGRPEPVLTSQQWASVKDLANRPTAGGEFTGQLYLEGGEFLGVVRGQIDEAFGDLTTQARRVQ